MIPDLVVADTNDEGTSIEAAPTSGSSVRS